MTSAGAPRGRSTERRPGRDVQSVTGVQPSRPQEIDERRRRYLITMGVRTALFLAAVFLFSGWLRWAAIGFSFVAPYIAVVVANAGPQRTKDTAEYTIAAPGQNGPMIESGPTIDG
jgi:hypothetical protein